MPGSVEASAIVNSGGGLIPLAMMGTGTPDGTKFLKDDGTWAVPPGGGGGGPSQVKLTADLAASTSTTLTNTTGLSFPVTSGVYYHFKFGVLFRSAATTTGLKLGMTFPAVTRFGATIMTPIAADGAGGQFQGWITTSGDSVIGTGVQAANTDYFAIIEGMILASANGTLQVQHASEVASSGVTIRQGSFGQLYTL